MNCFDQVMGWEWGWWFVRYRPAKGSDRVNSKNRIKCGFLKMLILTCLVSSGCVPGPLISYVNDVSAEQRLWGGYQYLGIYKLRVDMFLRIREDFPTPNKTILVPPRQATRGIYDLLYSSPKSISDYENNKSKWPDVVAIIEVGTKIQCTHLLKYITLGYGNSVYIHAKIIDGPYAGKEAEISDLSLSSLDKESDLYLLSPNPKVLSFEGVDGNVKDGE